MMKLIYFMIWNKDVTDTDKSKVIFFYLLITFPQITSHFRMRKYQYLSAYDIYKNTV